MEIEERQTLGNAWLQLC